MTDREIYHRHGPAGTTRHDYDFVQLTATTFTNTDEERARATRYVAGAAHNADDYTQLLDMLGLNPQEGPDVARHNAKDDKAHQDKVRADEERINRANREEKDAAQRLKRILDEGKNDK